MAELDMFQFYSRCLLPLTPVPTVSKVLELVMSGGETTEDFAQALALDSELQHWVRLTVQRLGFEKRATKLGQAIILLGQNRIRDLFIGRNIERVFVAPEKTLLGKMFEDREKAKVEALKKAQQKPAKAAPPPTPAPGEEGAAGEPGAESELIPTLADFQKYLQYSLRAEEVATSIRNSYPGQAFAGGVLFDYAHYFLLKTGIEASVSDARLKSATKYMEEVFKDGIRTGIAANEIMQKISIPHQKNVFVTALVHNIGKPLLLGYDPNAFQKAFLMSTGAADVTRRIPSSEAEGQEFSFDHGQAGALYVGRLPFLNEIEKSVDLHHLPQTLRHSNPKLYALACVLRVSSVFTKLYQRVRDQSPDTEKIRDQRITGSADFAYLRLTPEDWSEIKANYALKLMKVGY